MRKSGASTFPSKSHARSYGIRAMRIGKTRQNRALDKIEIEEFIISEYVT